MTVWAENPGDDGSAVWGCSACEQGGWCSDHTRARLEARAHAHAHRDEHVTIVNRHHGPHANTDRDTRIQQLRAAGNSIRTIADTVGLSTTGVIKALRRAKEPA